LHTFVRFNHIIAAVSQEHVAGYHGRKDIAPLAGRLGRIDMDFVLADRNRRFTSGHQPNAAAFQCGAGDRDVSGIQRLAPDNVAGTDEAGDELGARPLIDVLGRSKLFDPACVHHRDKVGRRHRFRLVVGHIDRGVAIFVVQPPHLEAHFLA
jgi:hypothetical protein